MGATYCNGSQCLPMFTCQGNFNTAPNDCPLFPLDSTQCGVQGTAVPIPWIATVGPMSVVATIALDAGPNEVVEVAGALNTGAFIGSLDLLSGTGVMMKTQGYNILGNSSFDFVATGSIYPCAHPTTARATWSGQQANTQVNGHIFHYPFSGKYNTGGAVPGTATLLANDATSGRVCDQVCGDVKFVCGDDREHYRFTLPAHTGAVVEAAVASSGAPDAGSTFNLVAANGAGGTVCNLVANAVVGVDPGAFRARIVNNTGSAQIVTIYPQSLGGPLHWNFAVAVEK
jgi:hypothetical protein